MSSAKWRPFCRGLNVLSVNEEWTPIYLYHVCLMSMQSPSTRLFVPQLVRTNHTSKSNLCISGPFADSLNPSPPSVAYMRQWIGSALVQMKLVVYSASTHNLNQCWLIIKWALGNKLRWNFNKNTQPFVHINASSNIVCEMAVAIFSRRRWFKSVNYSESASCHEVILQHRPEYLVLI